MHQTRRLPAMYEKIKNRDRLRTTFRLYGVGFLDVQFQKWFIVAVFTLRNGVFLNKRRFRWHLGKMRTTKQPSL